jgi:hypothetical protein
MRFTLVGFVFAAKNSPASGAWFVEHFGFKVERDHEPWPVAYLPCDPQRRSGARRGGRRRSADGHRGGAAQTSSSGTNTAPSSSATNSGSTLGTLTRANCVTLRRANGTLTDFTGGQAFTAQFVDLDPDEKCAAVHQRMTTGSDDATGNHNRYCHELDYRTGPVSNGATCAPVSSASTACRART